MPPTNEKKKEKLHNSFLHVTLTPAFLASR